MATNIRRESPKNDRSNVSHKVPKDKCVNMDVSITRIRISVYLGLLMKTKDLTQRKSLSLLQTRSGPLFRTKNTRLLYTRSRVKK